MYGVGLYCFPLSQLLPLPGNAQAKIEGMSRVLLNHVSQMPSKMPMSISQVTDSANAPNLTDMTRRIAVRLVFVSSPPLSLVEPQTCWISFYEQ